MDHIEIFSDFIGPFVRLRISSGTFHQEVETHVEDLLNTEFMNVFQELYVSAEKSIQIQVQNLRKTWTYRGQLDLLNVDEGDFVQIVNVLLLKVQLNIIFTIFSLSIHNNLCLFFSYFLGI